MRYLITYLANIIPLYFIIGLRIADVGEFSRLAFLIFWVPAVLGVTYIGQRLTLLIAQVIAVMIKQPPRQFIDTFLLRAPFPPQWEKWLLISSTVISIFTISAWAGVIALK